MVMQANFSIKIEDKQNKKATYPMSEWGKSHWHLLAFIHNRCVNSGNNRGIGFVERGTIQCSASRHPEVYSELYDYYTDIKPSIYLKDKTIPLEEYDEWDCINDMECEKLVENVGNMINPVFIITILGKRVLGEMYDSCPDCNFGDFDASKFSHTAMVLYDAVHHVPGKNTTGFDDQLANAVIEFESYPEWKKKLYEEMF